MFRNIASKAGLVGFALLGAFAAVAGAGCSSSSGGGTPTSSGGTSSVGGSTSSVGGSTSSVGGSTSSVGGSTSSVGGSTSSVGGATGSGGGGPVACPGGKANCGSWTTFAAANTQSWGSAPFVGGVTTFGTTLVHVADTNSIHVTGTVDGYGYGFGLYFTVCSDISAYTGVSFKLTGTDGAVPANSIAFEVQTNPDYPFAANLNKGACVSTDLTNPFGNCISPKSVVTVPTAADGIVNVSFATLAGGLPADSADTKQALGLQWELVWGGTGSTPYPFDITVSNVTLTGGASAATSCNIAAGGAGSGGASGGGAGGAGGAGGSGGASAGSGGASGGSGGASGGTGGGASAGSGGAHAGSGGTH